MPFSRRNFLQAGCALGAYHAFSAFAQTPFSTGDEQPTLPIPPGSVDCHMHLYDDRYPAVAGARLRPPNASLADYQRLQTRLGMQRMVIVTPSTYGTDNRLLLAGLRQSAGNARGVAVIDTTIDDARLEQMDRAGVRGIRFNLRTGGTPLAALETLAARIAPLGWHIQLVATGEAFIALEQRLAALPVPLVIDHMGHIPQPAGVNSAAFHTLLRLIARGNSWIKLSGPYITSRVGPPSYHDVGLVAAALVQANPQRVLWGSDWPHPTVKQHKPDDAAILNLLARWAPSPAEQERILRINPGQLYGFDDGEQS
ncbi:TPA: amidohydrolase family protein [Serratia rubidaea]|nr:amidohydrolase family protein [Serratia rubidaea]HDJ1447856.1 amidohydrolase family protein [Serratia rubidaea]HDJ1460296.1 amidohydrolase family protein [Serratia rubidaea]HDJ2771578.1 amidohydrolase family protein [Serratia rubidaea]